MLMRNLFKFIVIFAAMLFTTATVLAQRESSPQLQKKKQKQEVQVMNYAESVSTAAGNTIQEPIIINGKVIEPETIKIPLKKPAGKDLESVYPQSVDYWTGTTDGSSYTQASMVEGWGETSDGYMIFDLTAIPTGSVIIGVTFNGYVNLTNYPYWSITPCYLDPLTVTAAELRTHIETFSSSGDAYYYGNELSSYTTGWKEHVLENTGLADFQAALSQGWFVTGILERDGTDTYYLVFDGWNETNVPYLEVDYFVPEFGVLNGTVTELSSGNPLENVSVTAVGSYDTYTMMTLSDGTYEFDPVQVGDYDITVEMTAYNVIVETGISVTVGNTTTTDFALTSPTMDIDPLVLDVIIDPNAQLTEYIDIANNGNGLLGWDAELEMLTEGTKDTWDLQFSFDVEAATGAPGNAGAECDGQYYYTTRWATNLIHKFDLAGNLIEEFSIPGVSGLRDLAYDGTYFYGGASSNTIYQMDFESQTLVSSISSSQSVRNIAYDDGEDAFWVANWDTDIALVDMSGSTINTLPASTHGLGGMYGTAYDMYTAGGPYLWIFDQGGGAGSPQLLHQADLSDLSMTGITHDVTADLPPNASAIAGGLFIQTDIFPGTVSLGGLLQGTPDTYFVYEFAISGPVWISIDPTSGDIDAGGVAQMTVSFDATDIPAGTVKTANIHFTSDPNVGTVTVPVSMTVGNLDFGHIVGNVFLDGVAPYNIGDVTQVMMVAGPYSAFPNSDGDYDITAYPGTYDVTATLYGYTTQTAAGITIVAGGTVVQDFTMPCIYGMIEGTVTDLDTGDPLENAEVTIIDPELVFITGADGQYFFIIEAGTYDLEANADAHVPQTITDVTLGGQTTETVDFALEFQNQCQFSVILWDDYGDGWNGASITVTSGGVVVLQNITIAGGYGPETFYFDTGTGDEITTTFSSGSWDGECSYYIYDNDEGEVFSDGVGGTIPTGGSFTAICILFIYGDLEGTVTDLATGNPIEGAEIFVDDMTGVSGSDGTYLIEDVMVGSWDVTCTADGYNPALVEDVDIFEDQTTTLNFPMTAPIFDVDPTTVEVTLEPNAQTDETVTISNTGNGPVDWSAGIVVIEDEQKDMWDFQFSFDVEAATGAPGNAGAECDGQYYYTTRWATNLIHKFDLAGNLIEEFSIPGVSGLRDLAYDGTYFYGGASSNTIYQMDFESQTLVSSISSSQSVRNIAYDDGEDAFWVANWDTDIALVDMSGSTINTLPASTHGLGGMYGTAYDMYTAGGPYLWLFDQGGGAGSPQMVHQSQLSTLTMTGVTHDVLNEVPTGSAIAGGLFVVADVYSGTVSMGGLIQGVPDMFFMLELTESGPVWLTIDPTSGDLDAGSSEDMNLHFDATGLLPGLYEAEIHFSTDPNVGSPIVEVSLLVEGLCPAINLAATTNCLDIDLTWEMPSGCDPPDSWKVYKDGVEIADVTEMNYTDPLLDPGTVYTYGATAVYDGDESQMSVTADGSVTIPDDLEPSDFYVDVVNYTVTSYWDLPVGCAVPDGYNVYRDGVKVNTSLITDLFFVEPVVPQGFYEYKAEAVYYFGDSGFSNVDWADVPSTGVGELQMNELAVYPNPSSDLVNISASYTVKSIEVLNNIGQVVLTDDVNDKSYQFNVSTFENGIYFIKIETDEGKLLIRKITVN